PPHPHLPTFPTRRSSDLVVGNFMLIMTRTKKLMFLTQGYAQAAVVFPFIMIAPAYFAGAVQLGGLMQTANAFEKVQTALSFFVRDRESTRLNSSHQII